MKKNTVIIPAGTKVKVPGLSGVEMKLIKDTEVSAGEKTWEAIADWVLGKDLEIIEHKVPRPSGDSSTGKCGYHGDGPCCYRG